MQLGSTVFSWVSDFAQFYLVDADDPIIVGIESLEPEVFARGFHVAPNALIVYTQDCLRQEIGIALHDAQPTHCLREPRMDQAWTRSLEARLRFPSGHFTLSSPSRALAEAYGPRFMAPSADLCARIAWLEHPDDRYNLLRALPDVVQIDLWPA